MSKVPLVNRDEDHLTCVVCEPSHDEQRRRVRRPLGNQGEQDEESECSCMQYVLVVDAQRHLVMPCRPARARLLLHQGKAAVLRRSPFVLILKEAKPDAVVTPVRLKIDPGSQTTGVALVADTTEVQARVASGEPASSAHQFEAVRFDTQLLQNPEIAGVEYQRGEVAGMEVREYLLLKWGYRCAYCHQQATATNRWEIDHILPRSRGGSDRVANLALSCHACNSKKGDQTAEEFGHAEVQRQAKAPLKDAAAVNSTRTLLQERLLAFGVPVETGSGGLTKWNRTQRNLPKTHWLDAACVGHSTPMRLCGWRNLVPLSITAERRQRRQMCLMNEHGFPRTKAKGASRVQGFKTGDMVKAMVPSGKPKGTHVGKVAVKARGLFTVARIPDVPSRYCRLLQRADGYVYATGCVVGQAIGSVPGGAVSAPST